MWFLFYSSKELQLFVTDFVAHIQLFIVYFLYESLNAFFCFVFVFLDWANLSSSVLCDQIPFEIKECCVFSLGITETHKIWTGVGHQWGNRLWKNHSGLLKIMWSVYLVCREMLVLRNINSGEAKHENLLPDNFMSVRLPQCL